MPRTARDTPPPLELLCLNALWSIQEGNVKAVQTLVARTRPLAYTTIMTVLERLVRKGKLKRRKMGRSFLYSPEASRDSMRRAAVRELLNGFFNGSEQELIGFIMQNAPPASVVAVAAEGPPHASAAVASADGRTQAADATSEEPIDTVLL
ncbi:MAG TPA: BlaI/MecI/CopY family transcriptional regulator [Bryobacteraceae bacterium]|nr:BlaI/MecI/CopY family transcriptional regulator [Bryobacteraceae bacterium]